MNQFSLNKHDNLYLSEKNELIKWTQFIKWTQSLQIGHVTLLMNTYKLVCIVRTSDSRDAAQSRMIYFK